MAHARRTPRLHATLGRAVRQIARDGPSMNRQRDGTSGLNTAPGEERSLLRGALTTIAVSPEFAQALKVAFEIETVEELIRFDWRAAPVSFGPGYTRENVFEARGVALFYLDGFRERALTSQPIDPVDNEIASEVTSVVIVDRGLQQAQRWSESIEALE